MVVPWRLATCSGRSDFKVAVSAARSSRLAKLDSDMCACDSESSIAYILVKSARSHALT